MLYPLSYEGVIVRLLHERQNFTRKMTRCTTLRTPTDTGVCVMLDICEALTSQRHHFRHSRFTQFTHPLT